MPLTLDTLTPDDTKKFIQYGLKSWAPEILFYYAEAQYRDKPTYEKAIMLWAIFIDDKLNPEFGAECKLNLSDALRAATPNPAFCNPAGNHFGQVMQELRQTHTVNNYLSQYIRLGKGANGFLLPDCYVAARNALSKAGFNIKALGL